VVNLSDLSLFCLVLVKQCGSPDALSEEEKAEEFRKVYLRDLPLNVTTIKAAANACGINLVSMSKMPRNMRGYNEMIIDRKVVDSRKTIYYREDDTASGIENTILHETREMMERIFPEVCPGYRPLRTLATHLAANRFAAAVLLPRKSFESKMYETGLDVVALADFYQKSWSQVLLRMGEVLQGRLFFYGALYELGLDIEPDWKVTYWTRSWNEELPEANVHGVEGLFPRKGHQVIPGSLVSRVILEGRPCFVRRITLLDDDEEGLTAIAQPYAPKGNTTTKVALVVILGQNSEFLRPQLERTEPIAIERFHQHL
jgi:hypothetical protein